MQNKKKRQFISNNRSETNGYIKLLINKFSKNPVLRYKNCVDKHKESPIGCVSTTVSSYAYCSTTGKPTHLFRTKCVSLDSV
jgi:hypothetical protein